MVAIADLVISAKEFGIFDFFLPFILMFVIFYGLLIKTKIFGSGEDKQPTRFSKTISLVISLVAASYIMIFNPAGIGVTVSTFFANLFGQTLVVVMSLLAFLIVLYLMMNVLQPGATWNWMKWGWAVLIIALVLGVGVFISSGGAAIFPGISIPFSISFGNIDPGTVAVIVVVILTGIVIYFLAKGEGEEGRDLGLGRR